MTKSIRAVLASCVALLALSVAGSADAAYTSARLAVASANPAATTGAVRIGAVVANSDDPTARVAIYIPNGYGLTAAAAGTKLGTVTATAAAADLGGAILPLTGELDAVDPSSLTAAQKAGVAACLNGATAAQTWVLHLTAAGQTLDVPMLVVTAVPAEAASGFQAKLLVCLPPPDVPAGTPGRAQFGAKLLSATFTASAITQPSGAGDYRWTSVLTPYNPGVGTVNAAGTVETQSIQHIPTKLALKYTKKRVVLVRGGKRRVGTLVRFTSAVTEGTAPATAAVVTKAGTRKVGGAKGSFIFAGKSVTLTSTAELHKGTAVPTGAAASNGDLYYADLGATACTKTAIFGGAPCVAATVARATPRASVRIAGYTR
jgi:hypothetical protein